ncbi:MAG: GNAT family N-acetyltransferase [Stellaceae bacterium]
MTDTIRITIRALTARDRATWAQMRAALWPEESIAAHRRAIDEILADPECWSFIAEGEDGAALGFAEVALRKYANGCDSRPVSFLEGIWVAPQTRRQGIGKHLLAHIEAFLVAKGFRELGSDTPIDNRLSQDAHRGWGFAETERVVYFRKGLGGDES